MIIILLIDLCVLLYNLLWRRAHEEIKVQYSTNRSISYRGNILKCHIFTKWNIIYNKMSIQSIIIITVYSLPIALLLRSRTP